MSRPAYGDTAPPPTSRSRVYALLGDRRGAVAGLIFTSIVAGLAEAGILAILAQIGASLSGKSDHIHKHVGPFQIHVAVGQLLAVAIVLAVIRILLQIPLSTLPARIGASVQAGFRLDLFHAFIRASWEVQSRDREGHLQETMTSQTLQATGAVLQVTSLITSLFTFLTLMGSAFFLNSGAALIVLAISLALIASLRPMRKLGRRRAGMLSRSQVAYAGSISEAVRVAEETHVFGASGAVSRRLDRRIEEARRLFFQAQLINRLVPSIYQSLVYLLLLVGLAILYPSAKGHAASLGAVVLLLIRASTSGQSAQSSYQSLQQSLPFVERVEDMTARYAANAVQAGDRKLEQISRLAFENVSFAYNPDRPVLSDIDFEVAGGEVVGIIGPTGAGKSTLIQILLRLRRPGAGSYVINDLPAQEIASEDWHRRVAYVPQEPRMLHASVAENIRFYRDLDDTAVERAARLARIHDEIVTWRNGYETTIGPRADAVSGGQQQRICLARALVAQPAMLVLDEPTSALDPHSESLIQESLIALREGLTLFIIAHRMSTLDICGRVMVVLDGRLVAFDTVETLRRSSDYYRTATALAGRVGGPMDS